MTWITEEKVVSGDIKEIYAWDDERRPKKLILAYRIDKESQTVSYHPRDEFPVSQVLFDGFTSIPPEMALSGYMQSGLQYYMNKKFADLKIDSLVISRTENTSVRKLPKQKKHKVVMNYKDFQSLRTGLTKISSESREERSSFIEEEFFNLFPNKFKQPKVSTAARGRARRLVRNLDTSVIAELQPGEVDQLVNFVADVLAKKYTASGPRDKLLRAAKIKIDEVALDDVIKQFKKNLKDDAAESIWGKFLKKNLFLVDSKYIGTVPELNVMLASQRNVDFGMFDAAGYLDLFEIKKSSTKLLSASTDRGNFYWHSEATKAIVQAEKYLFNATRKATALAEDLKREKGVTVEVVQPRAVVIMGNSTQLDADPKMKTDFRILRQSLKNVEVILYDELLVRLQNQKTKIYSSPEVNVQAASKEKLR